MNIYKLIVKDVWKDSMKIILKEIIGLSQNLLAVFKSFMYSSKYSILYMYNNKVEKAHEWYVLTTEHVSLK